MFSIMEIGRGESRTGGSHLLSRVLAVASIEIELSVYLFIK